MFEVPGSAISMVHINEAVVRRQASPRYEVAPERTTTLQPSPADVPAEPKAAEGSL